MNEEPVLLKRDEPIGMAGLTFPALKYARIFISYRRQDSAYPAGILRDALQARFEHRLCFLIYDISLSGSIFGNTSGMRSDSAMCSWS